MTIRMRVGPVTVAGSTPSRAISSSVDTADADVEHRINTHTTALASHRPTAASCNADLVCARHDGEGGEGEELPPVTGIMAGGEGEREMHRAQHDK